MLKVAMHIMLAMGGIKIGKAGEISPKGMGAHKPTACSPSPEHR